MFHFWEPCESLGPGADKISLIFQYTALLWSCEDCCNPRTLFEHEPRETFWANILKYEIKLMQRKHKENFSLVNEKIARENQFEDFILNDQKYKFNENTLRSI